MPKKKTLTTVFSDFNHKSPQCPKCTSTIAVIKAGTRKIRNETIQLYFCKQCNKRFSDRKLAFCTEEIILEFFYESSQVDIDELSIPSLTFPAPAAWSHEIGNILG